MYLEFYYNLEFLNIQVLWGITAVVLEVILLGNSCFVSK